MNNALWIIVADLCDRGYHAFVPFIDEPKAEIWFDDTRRAILTLTDHTLTLYRKPRVMGPDIIYQMDLFDPESLDLLYKRVKNMSDGIKLWKKWDEEHRAKNNA